MDRSKHFESAVSRLEEIVKRLERGEVSLEEAMQLFREGTELVPRCSALLNEAEWETVRLSKGEDGAPVETEFEDGAE